MASLLFLRFSSSSGSNQRSGCCALSRPVPAARLSIGFFKGGELRSGRARRFGRRTVVDGFFSIPVQRRIDFSKKREPSSRVVFVSGRSSHRSFGLSLFLSAIVTRCTSLTFALNRSGGRGGLKTLRERERNGQRFVRPMANGKRQEWKGFVSAQR